VLLSLPESMMPRSVRNGEVTAYSALCPKCLSTYTHTYELTHLNNAGGRSMVNRHEAFHRMSEGGSHNCCAIMRFRMGG
jgi:hypothetical protein